MKPFSTKPTAVDRQRQAVAASATAAAKLAELRDQRAAKLRSDDFDDLSGLVELDGRIAAQETICRTYQERLVALDREVVAERQAQREKDKAAILVEMEKKFAAITAAATSVDRAIDALAAAHAQFREAEAAARADWPSHLLRSRPDTTDHKLRRGLTGAFRANLNVVLDPSNLAGHERLAEGIASYYASALQDLRTESLPDERADEEAA